MPKIRKTNDQISRKLLDRHWTDIVFQVHKQPCTVLETMGK